MIKPGYLPYGIALVTVIVVAKSMSAQMSDFLSRITARIELEFDKSLDYKLERARERMSTQIYLNLQSQKGIDELDSSFDEALGPHSKEALAKAEHTPGTLNAPSQSRASAKDIFDIIRQLRTANAEVRRADVMPTF